MYINKLKWEYFTERRTKKYVKGCWFLLFSRNLLEKNGKKLIFTTANTGIDSAEMVSKKVNKAA